MATTPNSIIAVQTPKLDIQQFSTLDAPLAFKTVVTGGVNGSKIIGLIANNGDSTAHALQLHIQRSGANFGGITTTLPASAGFAAAIPPVNLMTPAVSPGLPVDSDGNPFFFLQSTLDAISALYATAMSTGISATINIHAVRGDF